MALQQIQARDFEAPVAIVFPAVMTILQDAGFRIQSADRDTGLITAIGPSEAYLTWLPFMGFGQGKKVPIVSAFIEARAADLTRARLNFVMSSGKSQFAFTNEDPVLDPQVYREAFERIEKEIFVRQAMAAPIPPRPPAPPPSASPPSASPPSAPPPPTSKTLETPPVAVATAGPARRWRQASYAPAISVAFVDAANIRVTDGTARFWMSLHYLPEKGSDRLLSLREANCATLVFRDLSIEYFLGEKTVGAVLVPSAPVQAQRGSVNAEVIAGACGARQLGKEFSDPVTAARLYFTDKNW